MEIQELVAGECTCHIYTVHHNKVITKVIHATGQSTRQVEDTVEAYLDPVTWIYTTNAARDYPWKKKS